MSEISASACAKVILFGEHAVVYNQPAIAIPVTDLRTYAKIEIENNSKIKTIYASDLDIEHTLAQNPPPKEISHLIKILQLVSASIKTSTDSGWKLKLTSQIPVARGLGSSASVSIAVIRALYELFNTELTTDNLLHLSFEIEKLHHGTPSGIDNTVITFEKPVLYKRGEDIKAIVPQQFHFVIADTGIGKKTAEVVKEVAQRYQNDPPKYTAIFNQIGQIAHAGWQLLQSGDSIKLGELMNQNQQLLEELEVSSIELNNLIRVARKNGALGAKLCGAGKGGCMVSLADSLDHAKNIVSVQKQAGARDCFITMLKKGCLE